MPIPDADPGGGCSGSVSRKANSRCLPKVGASSSWKRSSPGAQVPAGLGWDPVGPRQRGRQGFKAAQGGLQGLGSDEGEDGLAWPSRGQRVTAPTLLPSCCSASFAAIPANGSLQPARHIPGCSGHLALPSLPQRWEMESVLPVPSPPVPSLSRPCHHLLCRHLSCPCHHLLCHHLLCHHLSSPCHHLLCHHCPACAITCPPHAITSCAITVLPVPSPAHAITCPPRAITSCAITVLPMP